ncbi:MAG: urea carboxylase [Hyphomonadaceae bacterium]|nr:urea carboxylase [Hyphomonadaceae bacterium]
MIKTLLIANRGAIACRIIRTARRMGVRTVALFTDADASSLHVAQADEAIWIGAGPAADSYLRADLILEAAKRTGAEAIHPGYGFLSENANFAEACEAAGVAFIGPRPDTIRLFGLKHSARAFAQQHGVALAPGTELLRDAKAALEAARAIGFPIMLKATAGGGGIGMRVCESERDIQAAFDAVARLGAGNFGDGGVFLERFIREARHVEVQVFGDGAGRVIDLGERDCSLQRRNQKVIEETPAPNLPDQTRAALIAAATGLMGAAAYRSAGTVEFLYDSERDDFFFLEVNTRLQVEHGVTEQTHGVDLVEWMIRGAAGDFGFLETPKPVARGASIQARLYAEDPAHDFRPSSGLLSKVQFSEQARTETWVSDGTSISAFYDPLLAKLIVTAPDRSEAVEALQEALDATHFEGLETNLFWLRDVTRSKAFVRGEISTSTLGAFAYAPPIVRVISGGATTTLQDYPGRLRYWAVGVPPSGPMDALSFRLGNAALGNAPNAVGMEFAAEGPTLLFQRDARACLTGADFGAMLDGAPAPMWEPFNIRAGQTLKIGRVRGGGLRGYLSVTGGWEGQTFLGSRSTFTLGGFGGHAGRALVAGDVLRLADEATSLERRIGAHERPALTKAWQVRVLYGPHGAPDFFTETDIALICEADWRVHHHSNPTGIRLIGPKPQWARQDGGEAGLHPSNIHDNAYAVGAVDFTGDMPIILGPDGPSLGGFVCPFVVIEADLWKVGQLAPGDTLRFTPVDEAQAAAARDEQDALFKPAKAQTSKRADAATPILHELTARERPRAVYRRQGDCNVLVEYGPLTLDIELRLRVHALMLMLEQLSLPGVLDVTPGVRSLQVHYDPRIVSQAQLIDTLADMEDRLGGLEDFSIPSRIVHLPLSWNDPAIRQTVERYMTAVRDDAPWTPDNIEFIRRINGLSSIDDVHRIVFDASYLVLGLGDVYLGAPVATPLDPRHRLVTTKYNPARTWTPPNVVGIGGAYMCIYGMEGPGGYQLFGRTIQVWNSFRQTADFVDGKPWLLRFFDQIRFFPVTHEELTEWRRDFPNGRRKLKIEHSTFRLADYRRFLSENAASIAAFQTRREAAFRAERTEWEARGEFDRVAALVEDDSGADAPRIVLPEGWEAVESPLNGGVHAVKAAVGARVKKGEPVIVIEAMKAECEIGATTDGIVRAIYVKERQSVAAGAPLIAIEPDA